VKEGIADRPRKQKTELTIKDEEKKKDGGD
jgi:hypothetical protein